MFTLSIVVFLIMFIVSAIHFYWAFGGKYGLMSAGPSLKDGKEFVTSGVLIFIVRAVGDFKYVGFFKKVHNSNFASLDAKYFSPLIFFLGVAYGVLSSQST